MKIGIIGAAGRMGKALIEEVLFHDACELSGGIVRKESEFAGIDMGVLAGVDPIGIPASYDRDQLFDKSDAVIDFSSPATSMECAGTAAEKRKILVIGTTGFTPSQKDMLVAYAQKTPIIWSPNMSIGVNVLMALVKQTAGVLGTHFDIEIMEMHHCRKVDAPSGTALALGEAAAAGRKVVLDQVACKGREGIVGPRPEGEIGFSTLRGGDVIGEHTVIFAGDGERLELIHRASNRTIFAKGAVRAALWAKDKVPGFYSMQDVLA